jgi:hypothetical protein
MVPWTEDHILLQSLQTNFSLALVIKYESLSFKEGEFGTDCLIIGEKHSVNIY